jgi:hypothetical protein
MISSRILPLHTNPGVHHYDPENKRQSMEYCHSGSPNVKKLKTVPSAKKSHARHFCDARGMLYTEFVMKGSMVNSDKYCATCDHSSNAFAESGRKGFFCIMTTQGHIAVHRLRMP